MAGRGHCMCSHLEPQTTAVRRICDLPPLIEAYVTDADFCLIITPESGRYFPQFSERIMILSKLELMSF